MARLWSAKVKGSGPLDDHHAVRYCSLRTLDCEGRPTLEAFKLRKDETYLSAFWLEYFEDTPQYSRIDQVRRAAPKINLKLRKSGRLVELEVRQVREAGRAVNCQLCIGPRDDVDEPSHVGIDGWASEEQHALVAERLLEIARREGTVLHPGVEAE